VSDRKVIPLEPVPEDGFFSLYQAHQKIYPRSVNGLFAKLRWAAVYLTQVVFYGLPWLTWNDRQAVLFDLAARKFYLFGVVLWPQDFIYLAGLLVIAALSLFFFTAVAGRVWCGYACPQTVYTEIFMWIEQKVEGDRVQRMKLDASPMSGAKLRVKGTKHLLWALIALWTGFTFIGYFAPIRELGVQLVTLQLGPWQWFWMLFYGFATWGNAGFMREQVCKYMCPYARFQSAMFDKDTMIVTYDAERGEPRGSRSRKADPKAAGLGSCVDCNLCVQVCPTGIDIRQGLQYECIGCAACIDVCDTVMDRMAYPRGLIRYSTQHALTEHLDRSQVLRHVFRPRVLVYATLLLVLTALLLGSLATRNPLKVDVIRDRNTLARIGDGGSIENTYRLHFMNSSERPQRLAVGVEGIDGIAVVGHREYDVPPASNRAVPVIVQVPPGAGVPGSNPIRFVVRPVDEERLERREKATFIVPR
jgi:cytochrome c oxidase accessory protein FixG